MINFGRNNDSTKWPNNDNKINKNNDSTKWPKCRKLYIGKS